MSYILEWKAEVYFQNCVRRKQHEREKTGSKGIFLFNVLAVFIFPFLGHLMSMSDFGFGMWAGTAVNDTSSVVAAGYCHGLTPIVLGFCCWVAVACMSLLVQYVTGIL